MLKRILYLIILLPPLAFGQLAVPEHGGVWVHDEANVLSASAKSELEMMLKAERDSTSNQIAVLIIPSLNGEALEDYAIKVAHQEWKLGQKDRDNGVLLLIVIDDRKVRIETGYGLEGVLTDALSSRINRNEIVPFFKQGDYDNGVKAGVTAIIKAIKGEYKNDNPPPSGKKFRRSRSPLTTIIIVIVIIIIAASRKRGGGGGFMSGGGFIGGFGGGSSNDSWSSGSDFGGGGGFGGGGSSDSW
ncbi:MAG TPA: TPM domain-containing protein [Cyclobacteriaceae bacterium]